MPHFRALLHVVLVGAFIFGSISLLLRYNKGLGLTGISSTLLASLLGASSPAKSGGAD